MPRSAGSSFSWSIDSTIQFFMTCGFPRCRGGAPVGEGRAAGQAGKRRPAAGGGREGGRNIQPGGWRRCLLGGRGARRPLGQAAAGGARRWRRSGRRRPAAHGGGGARRRRVPAAAAWRRSSATREPGGVCVGSSVKVAKNAKSPRARPLGEQFFDLWYRLVPQTGTKGPLVPVCATNRYQRSTAQPQKLRARTVAPLVPVFLSNRYQRLFLSFSFPVLLKQL